MSGGTFSSTLRDSISMSVSLVLSLTGLLLTGVGSHSAHRALAIWSLGADAAVIRGAYKLDCGEQRPAFKSPEEITEHNFEKHLGDERSATLLLPTTSRARAWC